MHGCIKVPCLQVRASNVEGESPFVYFALRILLLVIKYLLVVLAKNCRGQREIRASDTAIHRRTQRSKSEVVVVLVSAGPRTVQGELVNRFTRHKAHGGTMHLEIAPNIQRLLGWKLWIGLADEPSGKGADRQEIH